MYGTQARSLVRQAAEQVAEACTTDSWEAIQQQVRSPDAQHMHYTCTTLTAHTHACMCMCGQCGACVVHVLRVRRAHLLLYGLPRVGRAGLGHLLGRLSHKRACLCAIHSAGS